MICLNELPATHPDRNRPLVGCWYHWKSGAVWKEIKTSFKISVCSFNDLGDTWVENDVFTFSRPDKNK